MYYLAVRNGKGKGVYTYADREERAQIIGAFPGSSFRILKESELEKALEWAGVREISDWKEKVTKAHPTEKTVGNTKKEETKENGVSSESESEISGNRPRKAPKHISLSLSKSTIARLEQYAEQHNTSVSGAVKDWIWSVKLENE